MIAARSGRTDITNILLEGKHVNLDIQEENGDTAVIIAVQRRKPVTLRELVRAGSDLNLQNQEGLTPLMIAARSGRTDITNVLLEGKHIDLDIQEKRTGWSALHFSVERGDSATTEALLKAGANPHLKDKNGDTAVIMAVKRHEPATLRELVRAGSDLNLQNQEGLTPLMIAARSGRTDITNILLEGEHINLDIQEKRTGQSALHFSAEEGDSATTEALLKAGANPHLKDKNGATAMEITEQRAQSSLVSKTLPMRVMMTQPSLYDSQYALRYQRQLKSERDDLGGDDTSSSLTRLKLKELELVSEGKVPTAGQQSQIKMKMTPEMDPEHSPDFNL
ncbi:Putative ankyrin repeat protein MM_0045 [Geodia barretti]|uniref:Ankyrin repeat protein MM_0045 n=1 Tax=Geodia barretti TaxID=519541 RepID=A0AA35XFZ4_GEOBA|nr:Putative ankyrin repeat protein MM_0045 [Geodia barretti]